MKHTHLEGRSYINLVRCSSDQQADTSPIDQLRILNQFAAMSHMTHAGDDVVLEGVSGSLPGGRIDIEQVIARKRVRDDFDVLLVQDVSRFTRGGIDHVGKLKWDLGAAGVEVIFVTQGTTGDLDDDSLIQSIGAYSAQRQAKGMSYATTRGQMSSIAAGNIPHTFSIPYGIDRLYTALDGCPRHRIRNLSDGTQQKLAVDTDDILATYGRNPKKGSPVHYHRQSDERITLIPGAAERVDIVRAIYRRSLLDGWGTYRIALELNDRGVPTRRGGLWNTETVSSILSNAIYTGVGVGNRYATGIFHVRGDEATPELVQRDIKTLTTRKSRSNKLRKREDWKLHPQPLLTDYLGEELRELAIAAHERTFEKQARKAAAPKTKLKSNRDKHGDSPFILKGLLRSVQGHHPMTGRLVGPKGRKYRYYAVSKSMNTPKGGSVFARMVRADLLEAAVMPAIQNVLLDVPNLRDRIEATFVDQMARRDTNLTNFKPLVAERDALAAQVADALTLGPASRRSIKDKLDQWEVRLGHLERAIEETKAVADAPAVDIERRIEAVAARLATLAESFDRLPPAGVRKLLATVVSRLAVDLETQAVEVELVTDALMGQNRGSLCLVGGVPSSTRHEAQRLETLQIGFIRCDHSREKLKPCFRCSRVAA